MSDPRSRILVCLDKFRGSASAAQACASLASGLRRALPAAEVREIPLADGGEGTVDALVTAGYRPRAATVSGPLGGPVRARYATRGRRAVIEMAQAAGLALLADPQPLSASSYGVGELISAALEAGCTEIVLAVGGSACTDGGAGMLQALGARLQDESGQQVARGGAALAGVRLVDLEPVRARLRGARCVLASDVSNPLLGPAGAATVFAPQKGADPDQVCELESALARFADALGSPLRDAPGAGAGGGIGFGALAGLEARRVAGIDFLIDELGLRSELPGARLVIVGEGRLDSQSLHGKAPAGVAALARAHDVPVIAVAGDVALTSDELAELGVRTAHSLLARCAGDVAAAMSGTERILTDIGTAIGAAFADESEQVRITALVSGRVQGVGFRDWVCRSAQPLRLSGAATNLPDGRVEVVAEGSRADCEQLLARLRSGTGPGHVRAVESTWSRPAGASEGSGFRIR